MSNYNDSGIDAANTTAQLFTAINDVSGGLIAGALLIVLFVGVFFYSTSRYDSINEPLLISSFVTSVAGAPMVFAGWIGWNVYIYPVILTMGALLLVLFGTYRQ